MKHKHYLGILFAFLTIISFFNVFSRNYINHYYEITAYASGVDNITARADYLYNLTWTAQASISGWDGYFYYGNTYHLPYGQPYNNSGYIYWDVSIDTFLDSTKDAGSIFYSQCSNNGAPYYAIDCSAFASYCWDLPRRTTTYHWADLDVTSYGKCNWDNIGNIQQGDALNLSDSHVVIISRVNSDGTYEITEQTPPQIKRRNRTASQLISEFGNYTIYRYNNRENVSAPPNIKGMNLGDDFYAVIGTKRNWAILGNVDCNVEIVKETGGAYNVWHFKRCPDNSYIIYSCLDNKVLDAHNGYESSNVDVQDFNDSASQHWHIYHLGEGVVYLKAQNTNNVLDTTNVIQDIGTNVELYRWNGSDAQLFLIYKVDKAESGNLYIDAGNTISGTKFWWDKGTACTIYNLRIEKGEPGNTSSYLDKWNLSDTECTVKLPEGYYEAYVDFCNGYSVSMGRKMQFYVSTPVAGVSTISVSPGNKTSPTQFYWTETENTTIYNLRILSVQDGIFKSYRDVWNLTDLSYELVLPIGSYEVYVNACNDENYSTSNRITFDITESIVPEKPIIEVATSNNFNTATELKWNDCKYTDKYALNIFSENMVLVDSIGNTTERTYQVDLPNGIYIAKVIAYNDISDNTSESDEIYFEVNNDVIGDCNNDGKFNISDVVLLQKWLLSVPDTHLANWQAADLCEDGKLDVFDLVMMKRLLING